MFFLSISLFAKPAVAQRPSILRVKLEHKTEPHERKEVRVSRHAFIERQPSLRALLISDYDRGRISVARTGGRYRAAPLSSHFLHRCTVCKKHAVKPTLCCGSPRLATLLVDGTVTSRAGNEGKWATEGSNLHTADASRF